MSVNPWINLFERIPTNLHDSLAVTLTNGMEIVLQRILKLDSEFVVVRGRMAGTQDQGRVVIVPYVQLLSIAFNRRMLDPEVTAIFGASTTKFAAPIVLMASQDPDAPLEEPVADEVEATPAKPAAAKGQAAPKAEMPSKSILLAKLRARLAENAK